VSTARRSAEWAGVASGSYSPNFVALRRTVWAGSQNFGDAGAPPPHLWAWLESRDRNSSIWDRSVANARETRYTAHMTLWDTKFCRSGPNRSSVKMGSARKFLPPLSRSLKVIGTDTDRSAIHDFLLVFHILSRTIFEPKGNICNIFPSPNV